MGYTTVFTGQIKIEPPLNAQEITYLQSFSGSRRMSRTKGPYYANPGDDFGRDEEDDILDEDEPDPSQPSLWCHWTPTQDGCALEWNGWEKFYSATEWMIYLIEHFIQPAPLAWQLRPDEFYFLEGHVCNGRIIAQGEEPNDKWVLVVRNNHVTELEISN